ncbi:MAG TPA: hypothetical protein VMS17_29800 [Gemmataceae bacterium]|nr:hypothetical protein [Gemmataceae bacterium]
MPIIIKGVVNGKTIMLDDDPGLPQGFRATLHLILEPEKALQLSAGAWADMTPKQIAEFEELMTELDGRPFQVPGPDPS